jgi:uncharacterized protein (DUF885 family)
MKLKILEYCQWVMDQLGAPFNLKEVHNMVFRNGSMPLEILDDYTQENLFNS